MNLWTNWRHHCVVPACTIALLGISPSIIAGQSRRGQEMNAQGCRAFVQGFYDWYLERDAECDQSKRCRTPSDYVLGLKPKVLDSKLLTMLRQDSEAQAKADEIVGLDFDPFFNSQDPSPKFQVQIATVKGDRCRAMVRGLRDGSQEEAVEPEAIWTEGRWVFVNFRYYEQGFRKLEETGDLLSTLAINRTERQRGPK